MKKWIGLLLTMVFLFSAACALADDPRTPISQVTATADNLDDILVYGGPLISPDIVSDDGITIFSIALYDEYSYYWYIYQDREWVQCDREANFEAGTYRFECQVRIEEPYVSDYRLAAPLTVTVNGVKWDVREDGNQPYVFDTYCFEWIYSPSFTITEPPVAPTTPAPVTPAPTTPHPEVTTATPVKITPTPTPITPAPTTPTPVKTTPTPVTPAPTTPTPVKTTPTPITPAPTTPTPITPAPTAPAPTTPTPITPAPTTPGPTKPTSEIITASGGVYRVDYTTKTATFLRAAKKNTATVRILGSVAVKKKLYPVTAVADNACKGMSKLTAVSVGANVKVIGSNAFANCLKLKAVSGGAGVVIVGNSAFDGCRSLTNLATFKKATKIGAAAFRKTGLQKFILGPKLKTVGKYAFANCPNLARLEGGKSLITIQAGAFSGCTKLSKVPNLASLQTIGAIAFKGCTALPKITLCSKVKNIQQNAFYGCSRLQNITIQTKLLTDKSVGANAFKNIDKMPTVRCPKGMVNKYKKLLLKKGMPKNAIFK